MAELLDLESAKIALGLPLDETEDDAKLTLAIEDAAAAIREFAGHDFTEDPIVETRDFVYEGNGLCEIDDNTAVTAVALVFPGGVAQPLADTEWQVDPSPTPAHQFLRLPQTGSGGVSPEMGFTWNADTRGYSGSEPTVARVTATWGWPSVPPDVRRATILTVASIIEPADQNQSESIAGFGFSRRPIQPEVIPLRAQQLLARYMDFRVG